jgi:hypothetical protein
MRMIENRRYVLCRDRLRRRRLVVVRTLDHIDAERSIVDINRRWKSPSTQQNRRRWLEEVYGWYVMELKQIDLVLDRLERVRRVVSRNSEYEKAGKKKNDFELGARGVLARE